MIIYIDKSVFERRSASDFVFSDEEKSFFVGLANAHRTGRCYLCGDDECMKWFASKIDLFKGLSRNRFERKSLLQSVERILIISHDESPQSLNEIPETTCVSIITVEKAMKYELDAKCILLGENLDDCKFYGLLAVWYMYSQRGSMKGLSLSFQRELGGGSTIGTVLEKCVAEDHHLTLCLVDSDQKYEDPSEKSKAKKGGTLYKLRESANRLSKDDLQDIFEVYELNVHEVENLIPLSVLKHIADTSVKEMGPGVECLKLMLPEYDKAILYYDFKKGITLSEECNKSDYSKYWNKIGDAIGVSIFPRLCGKVLEKAIEYLAEENSSRHQNIETTVVEEYLQEEWKTIGSKVFSWACASRRRST